MAGQLKADIANIRRRAVVIRSSGGGGGGDARLLADAVADLCDLVSCLADRVPAEVETPEPTPLPNENALLVERIQALIQARGSIEVMIGWAQRKLEASGVESTHNKDQD